MAATYSTGADLRGPRSPWWWEFQNMWWGWRNTVFVRLAARPVSNCVLPWYWPSGRCAVSVLDEARRALESAAIAAEIGSPTCAADCIAHVRRLLTDGEAELVICAIDLLVAAARHDAVSEVLAEARRALEAPLSRGVLQ